jgi:hypothetical protein
VLGGDGSGGGRQRERHERGEETHGQLPVGGGG